MEYHITYTVHYGHRIALAKYYPRVSWKYFIRSERDKVPHTNRDLIAELNNWLDDCETPHPSSQQLKLEYQLRYNNIPESEEYVFSDSQRIVMYAVERLNMREDRANKMNAKWNKPLLESLNRIAALSAIMNTTEY